MSDPIPPSTELVEPTAPNLAEVSNGDTALAMPAPSILWASVNLHSEEGVQFMFAALGSADLKAENMIGKRFTIRAALVQGVHLVNDKTGELQPKHRTVFLLDDGSTIGFCADSIVKYLQCMTIMRGPGPWEPGITVELRQRSTQAGRRVYELALIKEALPSPTLAKGVKGGK